MPMWEQRPEPLKCERSKPPRPKTRAAWIAPRRNFTHSSTYQTPYERAVRGQMAGFYRHLLKAKKHHHGARGKHLRADQPSHSRPRWSAPPVAPEQPPKKHEMRSAVVRAGRPAVIKMNSMGGNIDSMGEDLEWARGRGEGAGNNGAMAGQIGQSGGAEKRQCSGVGPVRKRGGGIEMGGGVTAGPDGLSARPRAVARGAARGDQHVVDHLCQGHREAEHASRSRPSSGRSRRPRPRSRRRQAVGQVVHLL